MVDPELALGTLQTLARFQGADVNPPTRRSREASSTRCASARRRRCRSAAAPSTTGPRTPRPLFVMLLGELRRWGLAREAVDELLPHADRAIEWIETFGDRDGDGYVEYQRTSDRGLRQPGLEGLGRRSPLCRRPLAEPPIALAEVQGYTYGAYLARAFFAAEQGDSARGASCGPGLPQLEDQLQP